MGDLRLSLPHIDRSTLNDVNDASKEVRHMVSRYIFAVTRSFSFATFPETALLLETAKRHQNGLLGVSPIDSPSNFASINDWSEVSPTGCNR